MMKNFTEVKPLCYWVQHILPLVYDDSLSYMEFLARVTKRLNELIENNNKLPDYIMELIKEYISSGEIEKVLAEVLANYMLNVKFPPAGLTPATGDGTADDTEAIQGCIDYAFNNGGMAVYFPSGSYLVQSLTLRNKSTLFGNDRYTTQLVLKGGATAPLFVGNVDELTLTGLGFDGNMDIQVNNIDLIDLTVNSAVITNLLLTDGYDLLKITVNEDLQLNDIIFNHAVTNALVSSGNGYVQGCNLIFKTVSTLVGDNFAILNNNHSILEQLKFEGASPKGITVNGSNNVIKLWASDNIVNAYVDNGNNNSFSVYTKSESQKLTGSKWSIIGGFYHETITGNKEVSAADYLETVNSKTENISGAKTVTANSSNEIVTNEKELTATTLTENVNVKTVTADSSAENLRTKTETLTEDKTVNARNSNENLTGNKYVKANTLTEELVTKNETISGNKTVSTQNSTETVTGNKKVTTNDLNVNVNQNYNETVLGDKNEIITGNKVETSNNHKITANHKEIIAKESHETIENDKTVNADSYSLQINNDIENVCKNKYDNIEHDYNVVSTDMKLNLTNPLHYEQPKNLNTAFDYILLNNISNNTPYRVLCSKADESALNPVYKETNVIYIGDSFFNGVGAETNKTEIDYINSYLNVKNSYNYSYGSSGFVRGDANNFYGQLQNAYNSTTFFNDDITHIIIQGGINDVDSTTYNQYLEQCNNIMTLSKQFKNAKVYFIPYPKGPNPLALVRRIVYDMQYNACLESGGITLQGAPTFLYALTDVMSDSIHPNSNGYKIIAKYIANFINGNPVLPYYYFYESKTTANAQYEYTMVVQNGNVNLRGNIYVNVTTTDLIELTPKAAPAYFTQVPLLFYNTGSPTDQMAFINNEGTTLKCLNNLTVGNYRFNVNYPFAM